MEMHWDDELDELILRNRKLECLQRMGTTLDLKERLDAYVRRYDALRESRPGDFVCDHDEYWRGFKS